VFLNPKPIEAYTQRRLYAASSKGTRMWRSQVRATNSEGRFERSSLPHCARHSLMLACVRVSRWTPHTLTCTNAVRMAQPRRTSSPALLSLLAGAGIHCSESAISVD
jgi:hypothetical protein